LNDPTSTPTGMVPTRVVGLPAFPARLLVDLPNWLGDLVMALPATARLIDANRGGTTILHVRHATAALVAAIFPEVEVIASARRENPLRTFRRIRTLGRRVDIGVTMRNAARAKALLRLVSVWSAGTASQAGHVLLNWSYSPDFSRHQLHDADPALERLDVEPSDDGWRASLPETLINLGRQALSRAGVSASSLPVGLAPGVAWGGSAKRWPEENFGRLAVLLKEAGFQPVVIIGPGEAEIADAVRLASGRDLPVVAEDLDAAGLGAILSSLLALVGNDSGPAHLASALGVRTFALFGPTDDRRTAPMAPEGKVLRHPLDCAPCDQQTCPLVHQACLRDLAPSEVFAAVAAQLNYPQEFRLDVALPAGA